SPCAHRRVEHAADHQRRGRIEAVGPRSEWIRVEPPGDPELRKVVFVDLFEWRVAHAGEVTAVRLPLDRFRGIAAGPALARVNAREPFGPEWRSSGGEPVGLQHESQD